PRPHRVLVQPMLEGGVEVMIGVVQEPVFGPLVVFGSGGAAAEMPGAQVARLTQLTDVDAGEMIHAVHAAPLLAGDRGTPPADTAALADALLRVSRLADDLPEVSELDLNPVLARPDGAWCVDVRVQHSPETPSCAGCYKHAAAHGQPAMRAAGHTAITARAQDRPRPGRGAFPAEATLLLAQDHHRIAGT